MINEVNYCERLMYLEWSQGEFADNAFTLDGRAVHARADVASGALPPAPAKEESALDQIKPLDPGMTRDDLEEEEEPPPYVARSLWLSS